MAACELCQEYRLLLGQSVTQPPLDGGRVLRYNTKLYSSDRCGKETSHPMNADGDAEPERPTFYHEFIRA